MEALGPNDPPTVGSYRLAAVLGSGGMGRVYLAFSPSGRRVAIKVIRPDLVQETHIRQRFAREVAASRAVSGFFAAPVIDADLDADPPWLATAFIPGPSLNAAIHDAGPLPMASVRALGAALAEALTAVHAAGLIHRDLKPANVLLAPDGPRLIDFGISSLADSGTLTHAGAMMGSPGFMSPEQVQGKPVGPPTDIFAFGAVLAFTVTGTGPFGVGSVPAMLYRSVHAPPELAQVPDELRPLLAACLSKDPARRPDLATILRELTGGQGAADMFPPGWLAAAFAQAPITIETPPPLMGPTPAPLGTTPIPPNPPTDSRPPGATPSGARGSADMATREQSISPTPIPVAGEPTVRQEPAEPAPFSWARTTPEEPPLQPSRQPRPSRRRLLIGAIGAVGAAGAAAAGTTAWLLLDDDAPASRTLRWKFRTVGTTFSRPRVAGDFVYVSSNDGTLYALRTSTGAAAWKYRTNAALGSAPFTLGGVVYLGADDTNLYAIDAVTGQQRWAYQTGGIVHTAVGGGGVVYVGSADFHLYAVDAVAGTLRWKFPTENDTHSPTMAGETVYVGSSDTNLYAVDASSGEQRWKFPTSGAVSGIPAVMGGMVYFGSGDETLYAVDAGSGNKAWTFGGVSVGAGPTIANGVVYMGGNDRTLHALRATSGEKLWTFRAAGDVSAPTVVGNTVYVGSSDANLYAIDAATGAQRWAYPASSGVHTVAVADGIAYFGTDDNELCAVRVG
ncbi:PQQ-binding-like beta-propeller repeat protein [Pseudofrankia sp. BMG5.37]|uniref:outer membrane protein assembly factor BamB family protein n=1 Tax=Pseudofrankia sp. BMG5.37 TaxID=3050035 RepID=UPI00289569DD|nr:PQQ-binding-like beta-propeller repeat protein [Pseudofrankia sp. BMG5.37]MDT3444636.1 PQQ-binding-like beta-propeller repeat protein [Pseudofrankia sp. BMG5.37]